MEWIMVIFWIIIYFLIGGFINGLLGVDMGDFTIVWPVMYIVLGFLWLSDKANNLGNMIRDSIKNRKEPSE